MTETTKISVKMQKNAPFLLPTTEIIGAFASDGAVDKLKQVSAQPTILAETLGLAIDDNLQISLVENNHGVVHVTLPYYESLDTIQVQMLDDNLLELTSGGEIICIGVGALVGAKIAAIIGVKVITGTYLVGAGTAFLSTITASTTVAASASTIAAGAAVGSVVGAGVAATAVGIGVGAAAGAGAFDK